MGKKGVEHWLVVHDRKTNEYTYINEKKSSFTTDRVKFNTRYEVIAKVPSENDAVIFTRVKCLGIPIDAIEFYKTFFSVIKLYAGGETEDIDIDELENIIQNIKKEHSANCFGSCKSVDVNKDCALCYAIQPERWRMCACTKIICDIYHARNKTAESEKQ